MKTNFILYVQDQEKAKDFYSRALDQTPTLHVPGMTEFTLSSGCVLGLMPEAGIKRLLGEKLPDPCRGSGVPRAEVYLSVQDPDACHLRALEAGAVELSPVGPRNWGDRAGYSLDSDGHVVVFARTIPQPPTAFRLDLEGGYFISDIVPGDEAAYIEHLREKQIYEQTLAIPYPYTARDADGWIAHVQEITRTQGRSVNWAIREAAGSLIGGIGFHDFTLGKSHKAEIGYWLAKPYWSKGIMTAAVKKVTDFGFAEFGLVRITANVFDFNTGSARVLEKAGYRLEGLLRNHYKKDGRIFDGKLFAKLRDAN